MPSFNQVAKIKMPRWWKAAFAQCVLLWFCSFGFLFSQSPQPWQGPSVSLAHGHLKVSDNKHFLQFADGTPFFWLGDTAWELFHRLTKEETETYLENRRAKGFTVIQAVVIAELGGLRVPNREGNLPLVNEDPARPNEAYFLHVDWVIKKAAEKGMFIGLLPTWGNKVEAGANAKEPEIFNPQNAFAYGQWIANRYKDYRNIIWINGGDRMPEGNYFAVWDALGKGIKSIDKNHLMTYHAPGPYSSSQWFHEATWLDFNMLQTGHCERSYSVYKNRLVADYQRKPTKPTLDGEPRYEDHPVCWNPNVMGWFDEEDVRNAAYWSLFSGAFGHTYGCHAIWQFYTTDKEPMGAVRNTWQADLDLPGAFSMLHVRRLMESRPFLSRVPAQDMIVSKQWSETTQVVATRGDGYAFIYFPTDIEATIDLDKLNFKTVKAWWYDPRTGEANALEKVAQKGKLTIKAPSLKWMRGNENILVLDDASKKFDAPGVLKK